MTIAAKTIGGAVFALSACAPAEESARRISSWVAYLEDEGFEVQAFNHDDIDRLLAEPPDVVGLTAPGMPMMSPGMGSLTPRNYDALAFGKDGSSRIYSSNQTCCLHLISA